MQQLWFLYPALGICIPNLGSFLASNKSATIENLEKKSLMGQDITPLYICHQNISFRSSVREELLFSQVQPVLSLILNLECSAPLYQLLHNFFSIY